MINKALKSKFLIYDKSNYIAYRLSYVNDLVKQFIVEHAFVSTLTSGCLSEEYSEIA